MKNDEAPIETEEEAVPGRVPINYNSLFEGRPLPESEKAAIKELNRTLNPIASTGRMPAVSNISQPVLNEPEISQQEYRADRNVDITERGVVSSAVQGGLRAFGNLVSIKAGQDRDRLRANYESSMDSFKLLNRARTKQEQFDRDILARDRFRVSELSRNTKEALKSFGDIEPIQGTELLGEEYSKLLTNIDNFVSGRPVSEAWNYIFQRVPPENVGNISLTDYSTVATLTNASDTENLDNIVTRLKKSETPLNETSRAYLDMRREQRDLREGIRNRENFRELTRAAEINTLRNAYSSGADYDETLANINREHLLLSNRDQPLPGGIPNSALSNEIAPETLEAIETESFRTGDSLSLIDNVNRAVQESFSPIEKAPVVAPPTAEENFNAEATYFDSLVKRIYELSTGDEDLFDEEKPLEEVTSEEIQEAFENREETKAAISEGEEANIREEAFLPGTFSDGVYHLLSETGKATDAVLGRAADAVMSVGEANLIDRAFAGAAEAVTDVGRFTERLAQKPSGIWEEINQSLTAIGEANAVDNAPARLATAAYLTAGAAYDTANTFLRGARTVTDAFGYTDPKHTHRYYRESIEAKAQRYALVARVMPHAAHMLSEYEGLSSLEDYKNFSLKYPIFSTAMLSGSIFTSVGAVRTYAAPFNLKRSAPLTSLYRSPSTRAYLGGVGTDAYVHATDLNLQDTLEETRLGTPFDENPVSMIASGSTSAAISIFAGNHLVNRYLKLGDFSSKTVQDVLKSNQAGVNSWVGSVQRLGLAAGRRVKNRAQQALREQGADLSVDVLESASSEVIRQWLNNSRLSFTDLAVNSGTDIAFNMAARAYLAGRNALKRKAIAKNLEDKQAASAFMDDSTSIKDKMEEATN